MNIYFFEIFRFDSATVALPLIGTDFDISNVLQYWVSTTLFLACAVVTVPAGQWAGKYVVKRFRLGIFIYFIDSSGVCLSFFQLHF